jgi:hypothetical protein
MPERRSNVPVRRLVVSRQTLASRSETSWSAEENFGTEPAFLHGKFKYHEVTMKALRMLALMFAVGSFSLMAYAQQEVAPDHFDQPSVSASKAPANHHASVNQAHKNVKTASKHSLKKTKHTAQA